jgi:hypothetical protein
MYASSPRICTEVTNVEFRRRLEIAPTIARAGSLKGKANHHDD